MCSVMLALHAFYGCDSTSVFVREGTITARKTLVKHPVFVMFSGHLARQSAFLEVVRPSWRSLFAVCMVNHHTKMSV